MESIVKIIKTKLKLGKLSAEDERKLEDDIGYLIYTMCSDQGLKSNKSTLKAFKKLILKGDTESSDEPANDNENRNISSTKFNHLLDTHLNFLGEIEGGNVKIVPLDDLSGIQGIVEKKLFRTKKFPLPSHVYEIMKDGDPIKFFKLLSPLTRSNYIERFQALLWIEEACQAISLHRYDMKRVEIKKFFGNSYKLSVPGLAEGRPSLICGDRLMLKAAKHYYVGHIRDVRLKDVIIDLHSHLSTKVAQLKFDVYFMVNRSAFQKCHHAIMHSPKKNILFPPVAQTKEQETNEESVNKENLTWISNDLNVYQKRAVINVLKAKCRPAPYIIFGPPGTGKTVTLVESILQVYKRNQMAKLLVCGNSNTCADSLAARIKASGVVDLTKLVRVSAYNRVLKQLVPAEIQDITQTMGVLTQESFREFQIVVTTCTLSCSLNEFKDKFDYVFIDEAGHASEPEALISIGLLKPAGCIVLAGDPHQLGPVCLSQVSKYNGLGTSLLERLCKLPVYQRVGSGDIYDERYLTKLLISYRADSRVMEVNDKLFYEQELSYTKITPPEWLRLFNVKHPLVFNCVKGKDSRDFNNPSWYNANEAILSLCYVKRLYDAGLMPDQLGIITPYRLQIKKLRILFDLVHLDRCKIATMEEFQGDEKEVMIITTVRASKRNIKIDQKFNLGFLFNPKLFNVAISRAKWLVIVLGDPDILRQDNCWVKYLESAQKVVPY